VGRFQHHFSTVRPYYISTFCPGPYTNISVRVASYTGCPATGQFFNKTIESILDRTSPIRVPTHFTILLECARFSNRVSKTTCASLEEDRGISHHIVSMFEEEFDKVQRILYPGISGKEKRCGRLMLPNHRDAKI